MKGVSAKHRLQRPRGVPAPQRILSAASLPRKRRADVLFKAVPLPNHDGLLKLGSEAAISDGTLPRSLPDSQGGL